MVERAGREAKLAFKTHPHMLTHACGYALANKGHYTRALQAYLGHKNIQHTVRLKNRITCIRRNPVRGRDGLGRTVGQIIGSPHMFMELPLEVAVPKGKRADLLARLDVGIAAIRADGAWQQINKHWRGK